MGRLFLVMVLAVAGCGVLSPEVQLLTDFFEASRLHDTTVVARMSKVTFNPRNHGVVQDFMVERIDRAADGQSEVVTVIARVREFSGNGSSRRLVFTLRQREGRWFIADFR
jgi:hypothetical protein